MEIVYASLIIFVAYFLRSVCGMGAALVAMPILVFFYDLSDIVVILSFLSFFTSLVLVPLSWSKVDKKMSLYLAIGSIPMVILGVYILNSIESNLLLKILGVILILFAYNYTAGNKLFNFLKNKNYGLIAGALSGLTGTLFGTAGPPVAAYLSVIYKDSHVLRATLLAYFFLLNVIKIPSYYVGGNLSFENMKLLLFLFPAMLIATLLGHKVQLKLDTTKLKILIALVMVGSGISLLLG
jgi:hypothetical protein